jgi:hypothetical protein
MLRHIFLIKYLLNIIDIPMCPSQSESPQRTGKIFINNFLSSVDEENREQKYFLQKGKF